MARVKFPLNGDGSVSYPDTPELFSNVEVNLTSRMVTAYYTGTKPLVAADSQDAVSFRSDTPFSLSPMIADDENGGGATTISSAEVIAIVNTGVSNGTIPIPPTPLDAQAVTNVVSVGITNGTIPIPPTPLDAAAVKSVVNAGMVDGTVTVVSLIQTKIDDGTITIPTNTSEVVNIVNNGITDGTIDISDKVKDIVVDALDDGTIDIKTKVENIVNTAIDNGDIDIKDNVVPMVTEGIADNTIKVLKPYTHLVTTPAAHIVVNHIPGTIGSVEVYDDNDEAVMVTYDVVNSTSFTIDLVNPFTGKVVYTLLAS